MHRVPAAATAVMLRLAVLAVLPGNPAPLHSRAVGSVGAKSAALQPRPGVLPYLA